MSIALDRRNTRPKGLAVKTYGKLNKKDLKEFGMQNSRILSRDIVIIGDYEIDVKDFLSAAMYVLINTDLRRNDPRRSFLEMAKELEIVDGYNKSRDNKSKRLGIKQR